MLPDYMVPAEYVLLDSLPLTPNGKVDRKALPEPECSKQLASYRAPQTATQIMLCNIWQEVLGFERVGVTDNFFKLGGHSLLAIKVMTKVNQEINTTLSLKSFFNDPTIAGIAHLIDAVQLNSANLHQLLNDELVEEGFF